MQRDGFGNADVTSREEALAQLEALGAFRGKLGNELVCPWWNAPVMGGLLAWLPWLATLGSFAIGYGAGLLWQRGWQADMTAAL